MLEADVGAGGEAGAGDDQFGRGLSGIESMGGVAERVEGVCISEFGLNMVCLLEI